jgi:hypothetical protein
MSEDPSNEVGKLVELWRECARNYKSLYKSDYCSAFSDAYFEILDDRASPDLWWDFILTALAHDHGDESLAYFAAGPLEDFLSRFGDDVIERVENEARRSPLFQRAVSGVWRNNMCEALWERVQVLKARALAGGNSLDG